MVRVSCWHGDRRTGDGKVMRWWLCRRRRRRGGRRRYHLMGFWKLIWSWDFERYEGIEFSQGYLLMVVGIPFFYASIWFSKEVSEDGVVRTACVEENLRAEREKSSVDGIVISVNDVEGGKNISRWSLPTMIELHPAMSDDCDVHFYIKFYRKRNHYSIEKIAKWLPLSSPKKGVSANTGRYSFLQQLLCQINIIYTCDENLNLKQFHFNRKAIRKDKLYLYECIP